MKKILLINTPEVFLGRHTFPPIGLLYLASMFGPEVKVCDGALEGWEKLLEQI